MAKAFMFAVDSVLAIILLAIAFNGIYIMSGSVEQDAFEEMVLKAQSTDALVVLDKGGNLLSKNSTNLSIELDALLPAGVSWNLTAEYFNYSGGFAPSANISAGQSSARARLIVASDRAFYGRDSDGVPVYGTARLRIWNSLH